MSTVLTIVIENGDLLDGPLAQHDGTRPSLAQHGRLCGFVVHHVERRLGFVVHIEGELDEEDLVRFPLVVVDYGDVDVLQHLVGTKRDRLTYRDVVLDCLRRSVDRLQPNIIIIIIITVKNVKLLLGITILIRKFATSNNSVQLTQS